MPIRTDGAAPYAPPSAILEVITRYRNHGLQTPFNNDVLAKSGISPSLTPRTLQALELLDLVDEDGSPTSQLEALARAGHAEYEGQLAEVIRLAYADTFKFTDPSQDPYERVQDAFRGYTPRGQQARMVTLFLGLCLEAQIITKQPAKNAKRAPRASSGAPRTAPEKGRKLNRLYAKAFPAPDGIHPALGGLIASLPPSGEGWTQDERERFMATFGAVLDFAVPVREPTASNANAEDNTID